MLRTHLRSSDVLPADFDELLTVFGPQSQHCLRAIKSAVP